MDNTHDLPESPIEILLAQYALLNKVLRSLPVPIAIPDPEESGYTGPTVKGLEGGLDLLGLLPLREETRTAIEIAVLEWLTAHDVSLLGRDRRVVALALHRVAEAVNVAKILVDHEHLD
ncbi:MAG: hypothetical protein HOQ38_07895 [Nonomuraea sp.]|nr:hypothetical protein [Nonomuraea sp.]